jgi:hypothetical protein
MPEVFREADPSAALNKLVTISRLVHFAAS